MSRTSFLICLPIIASFAMPALGKQPSLREAALNAAVAAKCRAQLGEKRLFDATFGVLQDVASETAGGPSEDELNAYRLQLLTATPSEPEPMIAEMCSALSASVLPE